MGGLDGRIQLACSGCRDSRSDLIQTLLECCHPAPDGKPRLGPLHQHLDPEPLGLDEVGNLIERESLLSGQEGVEAHGADLGFLRLAEKLIEQPCPLHGIRIPWPNRIEPFHDRRVEHLSGRGHLKTCGERPLGQNIWCRIACDANGLRLEEVVRGRHHPLDVLYTEFGQGGGQLLSVDVVDRDAHFLTVDGFHPLQAHGALPAGGAAIWNVVDHPARYHARSRKPCHLLRLELPQCLERRGLLVGYVSFRDSVVERLSYRLVLGRGANRLHLRGRVLVDLLNRSLETTIAVGNLLHIADSPVDIFRIDTDRAVHIFDHTPVGADDLVWIHSRRKLVGDCPL